MLPKRIYLQTICIIIYFLINLVKSAQISAEISKRNNGQYDIELKGCPVFLKECSHLQDSFALLSCSLNTSHNNTQISNECQHRIWTHVHQLLDNSFLSYKLKNTCMEEAIVLKCLDRTTDYNIDCLFKKKPSVSNRSCWLIINKIESLIFNDWQIIKSFLKYCQDDIEAYTCGRIPHDSKSLSQIETLKCLQTQKRLVPECQSEIDALNQMKYTSLQLDKVVFAACNMDQSNFCPDELPGSWLMYKCLVRHKYETSK